VNKSEMADKLAGKADVKVNITGFGNFSTKHRAARMGRNPATGQAIHIAAKEYAHFSAAKGLKDRVAR